MIQIKTKLKLDNLKCLVFSTLMLVLCINVNAQNIVLVQYKEFLNNDFPFSMNEFLYIDAEKNNTVFLIDYVNQMPGTISDETQQELSQADVFAEPDRQDGLVYDYVKINHSEKKIILYEDFYKRFFKINDAYPDLQWELLQETKDVDGLECKKAITKYRGKTWEAWYAPSIALPYGPWKLHGLPGIIVEANDSEKTFNYRMVSISYDVEKIPEIPESRVNKVLSAKEYLLFQDDFYNNVILTPATRGVTITASSHNIVEGNRETEFEFDIDFSWEEN